MSQVVERASLRRLISAQSRVAPAGARPTGAVRARGNLDPAGNKVIYAIEQEYELPDGGTGWYHIPIICDNENRQGVVEEIMETAINQ